jgi:serine/threonine-protein kinase
MIKIGMMIGDRYEILEKIGTGGMSDVYKAKCHKLNRYVAVKVLKQEFSENPNFVSKFRVEAQAAAGLAHPNIVNVYDVGEENGIYYIVMELVEGITLKKYIEKKARLSYKEAVTIAIQVGMGIEAAHNNHIIHRDIKPQNIIISKDGKVKVTDFGIAKAASSNTITSNVMGSVHYTSPEQARGGYSDEKSDIYSLGITLFEMLTGRVPFSGETTVAIAIKHIQEELPSPNEYVPEIPCSVEQIVMKCCHKSPDRRYQSMGSLIADLKQALLTPEEDFVERDDDMNMSTRMVSDLEMAQIKESVKQRRSDENYPENYSGEVYYEGEYPREPYYEGDYSGEQYPGEQYPGEQYPGEQYSGDHYPQEDYFSDGEEEIPEDDDEYDYHENPKMEKVTAILAIFAGLIILVVLILIVMKVLDRFKAPEGRQDSTVQERSEEENTSSSDSAAGEVVKVKMPVVQGNSEVDALMALKDLYLVPKLEYEESDTIPMGIVIKASVAPGEMIEEGSEVVLTISAGTETIKVPQVIGKSYDEANRELTASGFLVNRTEEFSVDVARDIVISQDPASGDDLPPGSAVTLNVSIGPEDNRVQVPNVIGMTESEGMAAITANGLVVSSVSSVYHIEIAAGLICYQSYSAGTYLEQGTGIELRVSKGPEAVAYKYEEDITAPTVAEAPDYVTGTKVHIQLVTDDGVVLKDTTVSAFPEPARFYGITSGSGVITFTYQVTIPGNTTTGDDGQIVTTPSATEERKFTRTVEFTRE